MFIRDVHDIFRYAWRTSFDNFLLNLLKLGDNFTNS